MKKSASGWFKLLAQQEGEFYNVPIVEDEEVAKLSAELEVQSTICDKKCLGGQCIVKFLKIKNQRVYNWQFQLFALTF